MGLYAQTCGFLMLAMVRIPPSCRQFGFAACSRLVDGAWSTITVGWVPARHPSASGTRAGVPRWHLHVIMAGRLELEQSGTRIGLEPGDWYRVAADEPIVQTGRSVDLLESVLILNGAANQALTALGVLPPCSRCGRGTWNGALLDRLRDLHERVRLAARDPASTWPLLELGNLAWWLERSQTQIRPEDPLLRQACAALQEWRRPSSLVRMAADLDCSVAQIRRLFHAHYGCSPRAWRTRERMRQATQLLAAGTPVTETAAVLGYADAAEFSKQFRRTLGCPPSRWRP